MPCAGIFIADVAQSCDQVFHGSDRDRPYFAAAPSAPGSVVAETRVALMAMM
jgi:hypothetical protein